MIRTPQPAGRRPETEDENHGGASPLEAPVSTQRSSMVQSKPDIVVEAPTPPTDSMSDDGGYLPEGYRKAESSLASDDKIARVLELCVSQVTEESENAAADDDDDENSAVTDSEGASIKEHVQSSKPPLTEEEKELKRREKREKKRRKKEKKAKNKAKKEAKKARREERKSIANQSSEPSESTSHVEESEATTSNMEESETSIQEETPYEEIIKEEIASGTTASVSLTSSVRSATKHEVVKKEETQKDVSVVAPVAAPALPSTSSKQVNLGPRRSARVQAASLPLAAQPTEPAPAALANSQPSNRTIRKTPPAIGGNRRPVGLQTRRSHVGTVPVVADSNSSSTSSKVKNGPRSSLPTLPIAAECTEPAHANANSQPSNWIDRKTRPATGGERRSAGRPQQVARVPVVAGSGSSISSGHSPWTPSSRPGQPRIVLVSGKLDSKKSIESRKINDDNDNTKEIVKGDDFDVEKGESDAEDEAPQEYIKEILEKGVDQEQDSPVDGHHGAFSIRGNRQPSMQSTVMSTNTSVPDNINASDDDAPVDADWDAPLIAHLVPEDALSYDKIVVAVEDTDPRRRLWLMVAGFLLIVVLLVGIVLAVTLGKTPTQPTEAPEEPELWYNVADPIDGDTDSGEFGSSVSICSDGSRVAIGAQGYGEVKVFELDGKHDGGRIQIGQILNCTHSLATVSAAFIRSRVVVELAPNCKVLAIGCPFSDVGNKSMAGIVKLFKYESASDSWEQLGNIIKGEDDSDLSGASLALSQAGDRIAIGSPGNDWVEEDAGQVRMFHINNGRWEIVGMPINGTFPGEEFGGSVSLANEQNFDTHMIAVGSSSRRTIRDTYGEIDPESNVAVRVYELETGSWSQLGQGIIPEVLGLDTAWFVKLSSDGMELVVSNLYLDLDLDGNGINEDNNGIYIAAFELDFQSKIWVPRGDVIHRNFPGKKSGYIISLSDDGQRIGMGDPGRTEVGGLSGHAHFYEFNVDRWCQLGPNINGESAGDMAGYSVSLSGNGKRMVIASPYNRAQGREAGRVTVVELHEDKIVPQCEAISM